MRNISNLQSRLKYSTDRDTRGVTATRPNQSLQEHNLPVSDAAPYRRYERHGGHGTEGGHGADRRTRFSGDRRNYSPGKARTSMLVEFRNGRDRRKISQRGSEVVSRIDEKA